MNIKHEKTREILHWFEEISKIPRCSKHEEKICKWLMNWAEENGLKYKTDAVGNVVIQVPATPGFEHSPIVVIQGHVDMVCEKTPESTHDFSKDPIKFKFEGDWLTADGTSLGADNGIAIAMALVVASHDDVPHPPLELLFTVDEETGLTGANAMEPGFIEGKILINLDSEDEGYFTVGCAGGMNTSISLPLQYEDIPDGYRAFRLYAGGMKGGHSGIDINAEKANAIKVLGRALNLLKKEMVDVRIADLRGGTAHNAIPRDTEAVVYLREGEEQKAKQLLDRLQGELRKEFVNTDPEIFLSLSALDAPQGRTLLNEEAVEKLVRLVLAMPHGVTAMSTDIDNLVETSNNFASIKIEDGKAKVLSSQRSSVVSRLDAITEQIEAVGILAGGEPKSGEGYPPWQPNMESALLKRSTALYEKLFDKKPVVEVIHAGLECGIIADKNPGMDMISIGPTLKYPHSPDEKILVPTIGKVWDFFVALLKDLK